MHAKAPALCLCVLALIASAAAGSFTRQLHAADAPPASPAEAPGVLAGLRDKVMGEVKDRLGRVVLCKVDCLSGKVKFVYQEAGKAVPTPAWPLPHALEHDRVVPAPVDVRAARSL